MLTPTLEKLLILQDRDTRRLSLEAELNAIPEEIAKIQNLIESQKAAIENDRHELKQLESNKKLLETEEGRLQDKLAKYQAQQMLVKKNDEYQSIGVEIEKMRGEIGKLEEQQLEIMYRIDEAKERFSVSETLHKENITQSETRIRTLKEKEQNLTHQLAAAESDCADARVPIEAGILTAYDRLLERYPRNPVVAVRDGKCSGCHLKVESDVEAALRSKENQGLVFCDQCGRITWLDN